MFETAYVLIAFRDAIYAFGAETDTSSIHTLVVNQNDEAEDVTDSVTQKVVVTSQKQKENNLAFIINWSYTATSNKIPPMVCVTASYSCQDVISWSRALHAINKEYHEPSTRISLGSNEAMNQLTKSVHTNSELT